MSDATPQAPQAAANPADNENVMAAVATIPLIGLIIYFAMKDATDLVRFYAKQSIGLLVISIITTIISTFIWFLPLGFAITSMISCAFSLVGLAELILWLVLLINALQGKKFRIPVMSDLLDQMIK
jgi:uncharacterized membrane protein